MLMRRLEVFLGSFIVVCLVCLGVMVFNDTIPVSSKDSEPEQVKAKELEQETAPEEPVISDQADEVVVTDTEETTKSKSVDAENHIVCIDAGHQQKANMTKEPIGPGSSKKKPKVAGGTRGVKSGLMEYQLALDISLKLQEELESRGYTVVMVRTTNDVDISNSERAAIANEAGADAFVKIHADGSDISSVHGASALCQTADNPYNGNLHDESYALSECVLDGVVSATGCKKRQIIETDGMTGINWSKVPTTIIEVGYLTNKDEDAKLNTDEYQTKIAKGIADGIEAYYQR